MAKIKKKLLPASSIVTQANELVSARYILPLAEQRLVLTMIARIQPDDEDFKPYLISISELADFLGVARSSAYQECKKLTEKLMTRVLKIEEPGRLLQTNWISSAEYIDGTGMVSLSFDPLLKPYLLQLKGNFTSCKLHMLLSFKSQYTMRVYSLLKQYELLRKREISLNELREILGLRKDLHTEYRELKRHILLATQKELAEKSDLTFEFDEIKHGRRVGAIRFYITSKQLHEPLMDNAQISPPPLLPFVDAEISPAVDKLLRLVLEPHRARKAVQNAVVAFEKKHGFDYVKRNILYSNAKAEKSYGNFLGSALKADWGHDWELDQQAAPAKKKTLEVWERQGFSSPKAYDDFMYRKQMEGYGQK
jgi:hypothetical protein